MPIVIDNARPGRPQRIAPESGLLCWERCHSGEAVTRKGLIPLVATPGQDDEAHQHQHARDAKALQRVVAQMLALWREPEDAIQRLGANAAELTWNTAER